MSDIVKVIGVHPVKTKPRVSSEEIELVHLIEIEIHDPKGFDFGSVTQELAGQPKENWQVAYDEQNVQSDAVSRYCFFFHFLDLHAPLLTSYGPVLLPSETPVPVYLSHVEYEKP